MIPESLPSRLTRQFYDWERRGRGHAAVGFAAELEPPFVPFFGHVADAPYVDDGRRHTLLSRIRGAFVPEHAVYVPRLPAQEVDAYPDTDEPAAHATYLVTLPKGYTWKAESVEQCLTMLAQCRRTLSFEIVATASGIALQLTCREDAGAFACSQLRAYFPDCDVRETDGDEVLNCAQRAKSSCAVDFGLREEWMRPIPMRCKGPHDPYTPLFAAFDRLEADEAVIVQVLFCGTQNAWSESAIASVSDGRGGSFFVDAPEMPRLAEEKVSRPLLAATVRMAAFARCLDDAAALVQHGALALIQASTSGYNALLPLSTPEYTIGQRLSDLVLRQSHRTGMLLNSAELATLAHLPSAHLSRKLLKRHGTTKRAPAFLIGQPYALGRNEHNGFSAEVGIDTDQRLRHLHVLGATGTGKSTLLQSLISQDIGRGTGCCVLDPHGDLIDAVLRSVPKGRVGDVVLIDPSDSDYPVGFNILSAHSDLERELLASDLVALFRRFSTSWGDQLHSVLANAIMAFLYNRKPGHLGDLRKFLIEPQFRAQVLSTCTDEELSYYWRKEYPLLKTSSIGSIITRLDSFLRPKAIRGMVCQHKGLDFSALMDSGKIILVKLSQGLIGAENSYLLGAVIVAKLQQAAMSRQQQAAATRQPFFCYIDEFHHFVTPSMSAILSGARKYGLGLVLAHQDMQQLQRHDADMASALMSNVGTRVCFRLGDADAKRMQEGFSAFGAEDLQNLGMGEAVARVNTADADFNLSVTLPEQPAHDYADEAIADSRASYGTPIQPPEVTRHEEEPPQKPAPEAASPAPRTRERTVPQEDQSGKAIQQHRYLQNFIKAMAEQHGYKANIEQPTPDGKGKIDVVLERGRERIAVEVSVSTGADWELHNVKKCLNGGCTKVVVCSGNQGKLERIRKKIKETLAPAEQSLICLIGPEEIPTLFSAPEAPRKAAVTMKGYRVNVRYDEGASESSAGDIIKRIIRGRSQ